MSLTESSPVQVKADRNGFILVPDPAATFESIVEYMELRLEQSHDFFHKTDMVLDLRARSLRTDEIASLYDKLYEKARVKIVEVRLSDDLSFAVEGELRRLRGSRRGDAEEAQDPPIVVRNTCRSGVRIVSPSDCVILGDVNPGAEIVAAGDVVVFGTLRGLAHAGAGGERSARIWALSIEPNQLRIADLVAVPPKGGKPTPKRFEVAEIQNGTIQVVTA
ncbi:MAG: septum site-determining protein MinC [Desulfobacteraceae bacterium]|nr:septum site-determining protein MinC [Desulfobacteraceae bacterium]